MEQRIGLDDPAGWTSALDQIPHSICHTHGYCQAIAASSQMNTWLFSLDEGGTRIICPLSERSFRGLVDLVTPYGIAGFSGSAEWPAFPKRWSDFTEQAGYVCSYVGLNPLFEHVACFPDDALVSTNTIFVFDLRESVDDLFANMSRNRRRQLGDPEGWESNLILDQELLEDFFVNNFASVMANRRASSPHHLSEQSLRSLCRLDNTLLIGGGREERPTTASLFGFTPFSADGLFNVSVAEGRGHSAAIVWRAVRTFKEMRIPFLNIGGGVRPGDSIAEAKRYFNPLELPLHALRQVHRPDEYIALCAAVGADPSQTEGYFPAYHSPAASRHSSQGYTC